LAAPSAIRNNETNHAIGSAGLRATIDIPTLRQRVAKAAIDTVQNAA
jgi:hypothetical protein